jgi:hypothetical protein
VSVTDNFEVVDNTCGATLAANANCTLQISFSPSAAGGVTGALKIIASDYEQTHFISLLGVGVSLPAASLSAKSLSFAGLPVASTSVAKSLTITNSGGESLQVSSINISGPFAQTNTCSTAVAINSACSISVTFTPTASGPQTGTIIITDNAGDSPQSIALSGTGQDFSLAGAAGSSFPTSVTQGHSAVFNLSVTPLGGLTGSVSFTCNGAPSEATCTVSPSPAVLGVSGLTPITVTMTTTASSNIMFNPQPPSPQWRWFLIVILLVAAGAGLAGVKRWPWRETALLLAITVALLILVSCGGGGGGGGPVTPPSNGGTPKGAYTLTVIGTFISGSSTVQHQMSLPISVD